MALDFTVIIAVRQRFGESDPGNRPGSAGLELDAPFVGIEKGYEFDCPDVNPRESAILLFQSQGVDLRQTLEINGQPVYGGIPPAPASVPASGGAMSIAAWNGNVMLINPGMLQSGGNVLQIAATGASGTIDDGYWPESFVIDNLVVVFKTMGSGSIALPGSRLGI